jgi:LEA14-like dessication related protein
LEVNEKAATIEVQFKVTNPNYKAVILQTIKYELYENNVKVKASQIGERPMGMVDSSNYFTILNEQPTILRETITIKNTGNLPEFWDALTNNAPQWKIKGEASFNLSSITAGGEKEITFEFP